MRFCARVCVRVCDCVCALDVKLILSLPPKMYWCTGWQITHWSALLRGSIVYIYIVVFTGVFPPFLFPRHSLRQLAVRQSSRVVPRPDSFLVRLQTEQGPDTPPPIPYPEPREKKRKKCCDPTNIRQKVKVLWNLAIMDVKEATNFICYWRIFVIANIGINKYRKGT